ncbi:hypothetical protein F3Y22_tig00110187pilonHSYRG00538 [Hibiscus syriacus]|uniref:Uncharacterized protein n=1 Tax=Hibiscus syriacus TaxID=106335 RepID=A0A6A3BDF4_HIBSY|nr:hypothetical protein F3Y22_tig00110187pilonHSYRG00538 [Hibiscus syriacus]
MDDGTWVWFIESDPTWLYNGLPDPSQELSNGTSVKTVGVVASRVKGTASGWFHRAAKTILSWQWEDYRLDPLRSKGLIEPTMTGPLSFSFGYAGPELFLNFLLSALFLRKEHCSCLQLEEKARSPSNPEIQQHLLLGSWGGNLIFACQQLETGDVVA